MTATETHLKGCYILEPKVIRDERGCFFESFNQQTFNKLIDKEINFVQDNQSFSSKGVLRGLHYQKSEHAQAKLVRVLSGSVLDVIVDIRKNSVTKGQYLAIELSAENNKQLFVPRGFAHGFVVLSDTAEFFYKCDNFYNKESENGIMFDDADLNIDWKLDKNLLLVSDKDKTLMQMNQIFFEEY